MLKHTPIGEADRILTLFTPDTGKVRAVARGVRRIRSRLGGHLELLNRVSVSLTEGRSLDVVTGAEAVQTHRGLRENLDRLSKGLYVAELVDAFSAEHAPNFPVYRLLLTSLDRLERDDTPERVLRHFELHLLEHSGFRPELHQCVDCHTVLEPGDHVFSSAKGGSLCPGCRRGGEDALLPLPLNAMKVLRFIQREGYAGVAGLKVAQPVWAHIERVLGSYLRYVLERELKTVDFMRLVGERVD